MPKNWVEIDWLVWSSKKRTLATSGSVRRDMIGDMAAENALLANCVRKDGPVTQLNEPYIGFSGPDLS